MDISNLEKWHFEVTEKAADYLLGLVLEGRKRATSSSLWGYEIECYLGIMAKNACKIFYRRR